MKKKFSFFICFVLLLVTVSGCGFLTESKPEEPMTPSEIVEDESVDIQEPTEESEISEDVVESETITPAEVVIETITDGSAQGYFTTTDLDGNEVTQEIFTESKLTVVNVWATYCGPCIREMPDLGELADEYDSTEVQIIGIPSDAGSQDYIDYAKSLIEQTGADYVHLLPTQEVYDWGLYDLQYVPTTFFVNSEGEIIDTVVGSMSKEDWKILINDKLASL